MFQLISPRYLKNQLLLLTNHFHSGKNVSNEYIVSAILDKLLRFSVISIIVNFIKFMKM